MGSICFDVAPILRCEGLSTIQSQVLIIPAGLELIVSTAVVFVNRSSNRRFLLITAEAWIYFALALAEFLSHTLPAVRDSLSVFQLVDIVIAATSFLPLLFYTIFLFLFTRAELMDTLPRRFHTLTSLLLAIFIPSIVALNTLASFLGISHRTFVVNGNPVVAIGFGNQADQNLWSFLTSMTLAVFTAFQAINFFIAFFRITRAFIGQRNLETPSSDQVHMLRGIGWIVGGIKLGAVETVIGFATNSFAITLTRRILRFFSRALLCLGLVKGLDTSLGFTQVYDNTASKTRFRRSQLKQMVSNPRLSTFRQLSPSAIEFYANPYQYIEEPNNSPPVHAELPEMSQSATLQDQLGQRVTIHYRNGAPSLHMRFSALDLPSPKTIVERVKSRPASEWETSNRRASLSSYYPNSILTRDNLDVPSRTPIYARHTRAVSDFSLRSYPDSINAVRELVDQFPDLPPRVTDLFKKPGNNLPWEGPHSTTAALDRSNTSASRVSNQTSTLSASNSLSRRKPVPRLLDNIDPFEVDNFDAEIVEQPLYPTFTSAGESSHGDVTAGYNGHTSSGSEASVIMTTSRYTPTASTALTTPAEDDSLSPDKDKYAPILHLGAQDLTRTLANGFNAQLDTKLNNPVRRDRIKSVGKAPKRYTPTPVKTSLSRGSVYIEPILIPPKQKGMPLVIQEDSMASMYGGTVRDSEVLGVEEGGYLSSVQHREPS